MSAPRVTLAVGDLVYRYFWSWPDDYGNPGCIKWTPYRVVKVTAKRVSVTKVDPHEYATPIGRTLVHDMSDMGVIRSLDRAKLERDGCTENKDEDFYTEAGRQSLEGGARS